MNCLPMEGSPDLGDKVFDFEPMQFDCKEKMTYTEQAAKRKHCQRLTRYVHMYAFSLTQTLTKYSTTLGTLDNAPKQLK